MAGGSKVVAGFRFAALALLCASCTSINATKATFEGTSWRIAAINGAPTPPYAVRFRAGFISGVICNRFQAPYTVGSGFMQLGGMENTERGCFDLTGRFEEAAFAILHRRPMRMTWHSARRLSLSNSAGSIELERAP